MTTTGYGSRVEDVGRKTVLKKTDMNKPVFPQAATRRLVGTENCPAPPALIPCPLCGGEPNDLGLGISCVSCGLWLGDGTQAMERGGYRAAWNTRTALRALP